MSFLEDNENEEAKLNEFATMIEEFENTKTSLACGEYMQQQMSQHYNTTVNLRVFHRLEHSDEPLCVEQVRVCGLDEVQEEFIRYYVQPLESASTFKQLHQALTHVQAKLEGLGLFSKISLGLDVSNEFYQNFKQSPSLLFGDKSDFDDEKEEEESKVSLQCVVDLEEKKKRFRVNIGTEAGINDVGGNVSGELINIWGKGETLKASYQLDKSSSHGYSVTFDKPIVVGKGIGEGQHLQLRYFNDCVNNQWQSSHRLEQTGVSALYTLNEGRHRFEYNGTLRQMAAVHRTFGFSPLHGRFSSSPTSDDHHDNEQCLPPSLSVLRECTKSVKSSVAYQFEHDRRNNKQLPSSGYKYALRAEFAGLLGDVKFFKGHQHFQAHRPLNDWLTLSGVMNMGIVTPIAYNKAKATRPAVSLIDRFYMGGSGVNNALRGFDVRSVGARQLDDYLGADAFTACSLHLKAMLPEPFPTGMCAHLCANMGAATNWQDPNARSTTKMVEMDRFLRWSDAWRASLGAGVIVPLGMATLELSVYLAHKKLPFD
eukprot:CAMPEP_0201550892 /NCGR_PEP_ID=MMETSP0173_2-20130828/7181_1 /ASSEMBLY_ACC=CAM_ASM_000268 /TAXON_ID=218659 /ORGANISM="Vexillifera sp., Strain DIVA3 564/2" /LENGTH=539 /DNA_ID=CAMNT_0047961005 /DNA_START=499 /DNA_END=2115 /DNA_ORIENTATION=-